MNKTTGFSTLDKWGSTHFLVTCEHASSALPPDLLDQLSSQMPEHRIHDPGASEIAEEIARHLKAPLFSATWSRLVSDLNRSPHHPGITALARNPWEKKSLLQSYWHPYRKEVELHIAKLLTDPKARIIHLSIHTFTPIYEGIPRATHIGLLYDPGQKEEKKLARHCLKQLRHHLPKLTIHANQPYRGISDGHCTSLRKIHPPQCYLGFELEYASNLAVAQPLLLATATAAVFKSRKP